jgi:hypothetical protein
MISTGIDHRFCVTTSQLWCLQQYLISQLMRSIDCQQHVKIIATAARHLPRAVLVWLLRCIVREPQLSSPHNRQAHNSFTTILYCCVPTTTKPEFPREPLLCSR